MKKLHLLILLLIAAALIFAGTKMGAPIFSTFFVLMVALAVAAVYFSVYVFPGLLAKAIKKHEWDEDKKIEAARMTETLPEFLEKLGREIKRLPYIADRLDKRAGMAILSISELRKQMNVQQEIIETCAETSPEVNRIYEALKGLIPEEREPEAEPLSYGPHTPGG